MSERVKKKCQPLKCSLFAAVFEKTWDRRVPVDVFVLRCRFRNKNYCSNDNEKLGSVLVTGGIK
jgi:hypothetical protein